MSLPFTAPTRRREGGFATANLDGSGTHTPEQPRLLSATLIVTLIGGQKRLIIKLEETKLSFYRGEEVKDGYGNHTGGDTAGIRPVFHLLFSKAVIRRLHFSTQKLIGSVLLTSPQPRSMRD